MAAGRDSSARHTREGIVDVALMLLDQYGIADLSMRRLAAELDVQPSALYWHFENKQALLASLADRIVAPVSTLPPDTSSDPRALAIALRVALLAHRDGAEVVLSTYALTLGAGAAHARLRDALADARPLSDADACAAAILQFILGNASVVQQRLHAQRFGVLDMPIDAIVAGADREFMAGLELLTATI